MEWTSRGQGLCWMFVHYTTKCLSSSLPSHCDALWRLQIYTWPWAKQPGPGHCRNQPRPAAQRASSQRLGALSSLQGLRAPDNPEQPADPTGWAIGWTSIQMNNTRSPPFLPGMTPGPWTQTPRSVLTGSPKHSPPGKSHPWPWTSSWLHSSCSTVVLTAFCYHGYHCSWFCEAL